MHPFTQSKDQSLSTISESELLRRMRIWFGQSAPPSPFGMGDDTAVIPKQSNLITSDSLLYQRHWDDSISPEAAGAKLLKRNLSDIAAMGGKPTQAVIAASLQPNLSLEWMERFTRGLAQCALRYAVELVGGDLTRSDHDLFFNLTLLGIADKPVLRTGASLGDHIWVTGELGGSIHQHHVDFIPRLTEGQWLAQQPEVQSMIDVTDGLAKDLPALLPPDSHAAIDPDKIPLSASIASLPSTEAIQHALCDGEDYELLFTTKHSSDPTVFAQRWKSSHQTSIAYLGTIKSGSNGNLLHLKSGQPLHSDSGYEHFRPT